MKHGEAVAMPHVGDVVYSFLRQDWTMQVFFL